MFSYNKLEYLTVYGRASMGVPVGELQSTKAPTTDCDWTAIGPRTTFCHGRTETDNLSRASQRARGATKNIEKEIKTRNAWQSLAYSPLGAIVSPPSEYL